MNYIQKRSNGNYYYRRRVPKHVREFTEQDVINISLKTKDLHVAERKAAYLSAQMEALWDDLWMNGGNAYEAKYKRATKVAKMFGFAYLPTEQIIDKGTPEILARLDPIEAPPTKKEANKVESLLGGVKEPPLMLDDCFDKFLEFSRADIVSKSEAQQKRWRSPRETAFNSFIAVIGNKPITEITRDDVLKFRSFHIDRYEHGEITAHTVNRQVERTKVILRKIEDTLQLGCDIDGLFKKTKLKESTNQRAAFEPEYIANTLLNQSYFNGLNEEAYLIIPMTANTGLRLSEICGLEPEDIHLNAPIPYVSICAKKNKELKTPHSARDIPLLGASLWAFKQRPKGLEHYHQKADTLSACLNKFMRENELRPTPQHSIYSLRHSFQDLLRQHGVDERIQCELMGHKYHRPAYGAPTLEEKHAAIANFAFDMSKA